MGCYGWSGGGRHMPACDQMTGLEVRPGTPREAKIAKRCEMWRREAAVVVPLLQGLSGSQIVPHSGFAAVRGFPAGSLNSGCFGDLARADAPRAGFDVLRPAIHHRSHAVEIGQPSPLAHVVGVGDLAACNRPLAADFTSLRHRPYPPQGPHKGLNLIAQVASFCKSSGWEGPPLPPLVGAARGAYLRNGH